MPLCCVGDLHGLIEVTMPDKLGGRVLKYRLTEKGRKALRERTGGAR